MVARTKGSTVRAKKLVKAGSKRRKVYDESGSESESVLESEEYKDGDDEIEDKDEDEDEDFSSALDSDALDEDVDERSTKRNRKSPRKRVSTSRKKQAQGSSRKRDEVSDEDNEDLEEGQVYVGKVVEAPKTGKVPAGQISKNTFDFLSHLLDPRCNDRVWFKLHEPMYRQAEKEWVAFVDDFTGILTEDVDSQIPPLPAKDVIHRIYRDVRFSNDKTPYKKGFQASYSRGGRKGIWGHYFVQVQPQGGSILAAGIWSPAKNELASIRHHIQRSSTPLWNVLKNPEFIKEFGEPKPISASPSKAKKKKSSDSEDDNNDGEMDDLTKKTRRSVFGHDDELKVAPKGISKNHKDIDLLKVRSFAVVHRFTDEQVLDVDFKHELARVCKVARPLVRLLNDMMTIQDAGDDDENDD